MSHQPVIPLSALLAPIDEASPSGEPLNLNDSEGPYYVAKFAVEAARSAEREERKRESLGAAADDMVDDLGQRLETADPDWLAVRDATLPVLQSQSKDLRLAAWLTESLIREDGYAGLRDGLSLCRDLCTQFWESLHPRPTDEDGHSEAMKGLRSLAEPLAIEAIRRIPVAAAADGRRLSIYDFQIGFEGANKSAEEQKKLRNLGQIAREEFEAAMRAASEEALSALQENVDTALEAVSELAEFLRERCLPDQHGEATDPPLSELRETLQQVSRVVAGFGRVAVVVVDPPPGGAAGATNNGISVTGESPEVNVAAGTIDSRRAAFAAIEKIADYLAQTEPNSPVPYLLRRAVRWGALPFPDLVQELTDSAEALTHIRDRVGFPNKAPSDGDQEEKDEEN